MAGDQNRNRVRAARAADRPDGPGLADLPRDFAVAFRFAKGDFPQRIPDALLKFRAGGQIERRKSLWRATGENFLQGGFGQAVPAGNFGGNR